jgi:hypothetical protein
VLKTRDHELLDFSPEELAEGVRLLGKRWQRRTGSLFLGLGRRRRGESNVNEWCVKFYVCRKPKQPAGRRRVPKYVSLRVVSKDGSVTMRFPTDVVEV